MDTKLNREKVVALLCLLILLAGLYRLAVGLISSGPPIRIPDVDHHTDGYDRSGPLPPDSLRKRLKVQYIFQIAEISCMIGAVRRYQVI